jgi:hypothetical protein
VGRIGKTNATQSGFSATTVRLASQRRDLDVKSLLRGAMSSTKANNTKTAAKAPIRMIVSILTMHPKAIDLLEAPMFKSFPSPG